LSKQCKTGALRQVSITMKLERCPRGQRSTSLKLPQSSLICNRLQAQGSDLVVVIDHDTVEVCRRHANPLKLDSF
jgi:endonuclease/exonuclease/phosphatase (EEP) superfamily protein YafD